MSLLESLSFHWIHCIKIKGENLPLMHNDFTVLSDSEENESYLRVLKLPVNPIDLAELIKEFI